jgi:hypothetical protein
MDGTFREGTAICEVYFATVICAGAAWGC